MQECDRGKDRSGLISSSLSAHSASDPTSPQVRNRADLRRCPGRHEKSDKLDLRGFVSNADSSTMVVESI